VIAQEIGEFSVKPYSITNLDCKLVRGRQFLHERNDSVQKLMSIPENAATEERKLKNDWPELVPENVHRFEELSQVWVITCGTLTENMNPSGVREAQLLTVRAVGQA